MCRHHCFAQKGIHSQPLSDHQELQGEQLNCFEEGFRVPKKVQQAPGLSPKVDLAAGSGHHQYRACSGMAAGRSAFTRTVRRRLLEDDLVSRRAAKKPLPCRKNIRDRLIFCKRYRDWTAEDWGKVIFSDESPFRLFGASGKKLVWRRQGERYHQSCVMPQ